MARLTDNTWVRYVRHEGNPIKHDHQLLTPIIGQLCLRLPFWAFVWSRPLAIRIEDGESTRELPIVDVTLLAQAGLIIIGLAASILGLLARQTRDRA
jgi:hypothetical protein